jgi:WD40 repeat protein
LAAAHDLGATIWDVSSGEELHFFAAERRRQWFSSAYFSPDDSQLVTTGRLPRILLWDLQTGGNTPATRRIQTGRTVVFSPDGRQFAVSGRPTIYDVASGERRMEFLGHRGGVNTVSFNRDGTRLVTAGDDGTVRIWHTATGRELLTLEGHQGKVYSASFSPDGSGLVSSSADGTIRIWKAAKQDM